MDQQSSVPYIVVGIDGTASRNWRRPDGSNSSVYKFGVLGPGRWVKEIQIQIDKHNNRQE